MIALPEGISADDISQWLGGGVCLVRLGSENIPAVLGTVSDTTGRLVMYAATRSRGRQQQLVVPPEDVFAHWPLCGSVNLLRNKFAVTVNRLQVKQWRRTYNARCVEVLVPRRLALLAERPDVATLLARLSGGEASVVEAVFHPTYFDWREAQNLLGREGWFSVALSPQTIVVKADEPLIYYRNSLAGRIRDGKIVPTSDYYGPRLLKQFKGELHL